MTFSLLPLSEAAVAFTAAVTRASSAAAEKPRDAQRRPRQVNFRLIDRNNYWHRQSVKPLIRWRSSAAQCSHIRHRMIRGGFAVCPQNQHKSIIYRRGHECRKCVKTLQWSGHLKFLPYPIPQEPRLLWALYIGRFTGRHGSLTWHAMVNVAVFQCVSKMQVRCTIINITGSVSQYASNIHAVK